MEIVDVKNWVDKNLESSREMSGTHTIRISTVGVTHWKINVVYAATDEEWAGRCIAKNEDGCARIELNCSYIDDEHDLKRTLIHEICHISHSPFETYRKAVNQLITDKEAHAIDEMFSVAAELTVKNIERLLKEVE